jgi:hypothetical protein
VLSASNEYYANENEENKIIPMLNMKTTTIPSKTDEMKNLIKTIFIPVLFFYYNLLTYAHIGPMLGI